jgi:hypothetical protein
MRVDTDTYIWGVAKIVIERKVDGDNDRTLIRLVGPDGEEANSTLCVWGVGNMGSRRLPSITLIEGDESNERELVPGDPKPPAKADKP